MASNHQQSGPSTSTSIGSALPVHSCEICGQSGLSDEKMLDHTQKCHVDGSAACPFCGLTGTSSAELLLHVNQAHLDYLTPENELMSFIDDSKSADGDSDSMSCGLSPSITEIPGITTTTNNHELTATISLENGTKSKNLTNGTNGIKHQPATVTAVKSKTQPYTGTCTKVSNGKISNGMTNGSCKPEPVIFTYNNVMDDNNNSNNANCDNEKENGVNVNGVSQNHGEGSPLRSQLGLKLKANNKPKITIPAIPSPLMCLMCPYTTKDPRTLEEHINRSHFDPISPGVNAGAHGGGTSNHVDTLDAFQCPICVRCFETCGDLELHVNHEHSDILSPAKVDTTTAYATAALTNGDEATCNLCPVCGISLATMKTQEMELHIESHFTKSPVVAVAPDLEKEAQKLREQREFEMLRAQYVSRAICGSFGRFKNSFHLPGNGRSGQFPRTVGCRHATSSLRWRNVGRGLLLSSSWFARGRVERSRWWLVVHQICCASSGKPVSGFGWRHQKLCVLGNRSLRLELRRQGLGLRLSEHPDAAIVAVPESKLQWNAASCHRVKLYAEHFATSKDGRKCLGARLRCARERATRLQAPQYQKMDRRNGNHHTVFLDENRVSIGRFSSTYSFKRMSSWPL